MRDPGSDDPVKLHQIVFLLIFIGVWLIYNAVLASGIQQSDSVICPPIL